VQALKIRSQGLDFGLKDETQSKIKNQKSKILWVGSIDGMERTLVEKAGLPFEAISAMGLRGKNPFAALKALWMLGQGYRQSSQIIQRFRPDVLFVTGGYVCVPMTLVAKRFGVPIIIYLPDIEPGWAIKFLAHFAKRVAVTTAETVPFFKQGLTVVTGYPVRAELFNLNEPNKNSVFPKNRVFEKLAQRKAMARHQLGLIDDLPVLLVFGGSRGARSLNQAITAELEAYLQICQIVHVSGTLDEAWVQAKRNELSADVQPRYHPTAYLHDDMITALLAADLVVSRAGASVLGEFPSVGLPSILVPYPYAGAHQTANANYLAKHEAAIVIQEVDIKQFLRETVIRIITNRQKLKTMGQACQALAKPEAAAKLAQLILEN